MPIFQLEYLADNAARLDQPLYFTDQGVFERPILEVRGQRRKPKAKAILKTD